LRAEEMRKKAKEKKRKQYGPNYYTANNNEDSVPGSQEGQGGYDYDLGMFTFIHIHIRIHK
jgi:hypothetical protein